MPNDVALNDTVLPVSTEELCNANYAAGKKHGREEGLKLATKKVLDFLEREAGTAFIKGAGSTPDAWKAYDKAQTLRDLHTKIGALFEEEKP